jgi:penicillin-binding protein 2
MKFFRRKRVVELGLDEIFQDSLNKPAFNTGRFEGRLESPLSTWSLYAIGVVFAFASGVFLYQLTLLQIVNGEEYRERSETNRLDTNVRFAERGPVVDRTGEQLVWNERSDPRAAFSNRVYSTRHGISTVTGYVSYPKKDSSGFYFRTEYIGRGGVEESHDERLRGQNGEQLLEVDASGNLVSGHIVHEPVPGNELVLSIDAEVSEALYDYIASTTKARGFRSGAGALMDVHTGELIAIASYPSFDANVMVAGNASSTIQEWNNDPRLPFLNKVIGGLYTPGSIVKPFVALAALKNETVLPTASFVSTGRLVIPNPYTPSKPSVFTDWKAHGSVDMRRAISVSSNIYFYIVGGGFEGQKGIGISKLYDFFTSTIHLNQKSGINLGGEVESIIPNPAWKQETFKDDWRIGDTYLTSIGQFGFQTTPLAMLRAYAAIANGGTLVTPTILKVASTTNERVPSANGVATNIPSEHIRIIREGMRQAAIDGTAKSLKRDDVHFAAKTGTAELGASKAYVNSWVTGYYPYEKPKYAFIFLMEHGPRANLFGSAPAFGQFVHWLQTSAPEYLYIN